MSGDEVSMSQAARDFVEATGDAVADTASGLGDVVLAAGDGAAWLGDTLVAGYAVESVGSLPVGAEFAQGAAEYAADAEHMLSEAGQAFSQAGDAIWGATEPATEPGPTRHFIHDGGA